LKNAEELSNIKNANLKQQNAKKLKEEVNLSNASIS